MQTINHQNQVTAAEQLLQDRMADQIQAALKKADTSHVVIGEMPTRGDEVSLNGLRFKVESVSKKGNIHMSLIGA